MGNRTPSRDSAGVVKIVFLIRSLNYGGAERQLVALAKGLHQRGHIVVVTVFYPQGPLEQGLHDTGVPVRVLEKGGRWDVFGWFVRLVRLLQREQPDLLQSYLVVPNLLTLLLKPLFPRIKMVWGVRASNMDLRHYDWLATATFTLSRWTAHWADLIIANSKAGMRYHHGRGYPAEKMLVVPNGIDMQRFCPDLQARYDVRTAWGVTEHETLIGLVGRLDPMKDHSTFLQAASLLIKQRKDLRFVCVGDGPSRYGQRLRSLGSQLGLNGFLIWTAARPDMPAVYNALDIATTSSAFGEGFPNVIGEAMACGVPCVVTDVGDSSFIVSDRGRVVPPRNPQRLAGAWNQLLEMPPGARKELGAAARSRIEEYFNLPLIVTRYENIYQDLVNHVRYRRVS